MVNHVGKSQYAGKACIVREYDHTSASYRLVAYTFDSWVLFERELQAVVLDMDGRPRMVDAAAVQFPHDIKTDGEG